MIAFDTDMIGPYGYCADLSRSWTCGYTKMTDVQQSVYSAARDQIDHNLALVKPGVSFAEFNEKSTTVGTTNSMTTTNIDVNMRITS